MATKITNVGAMMVPLLTPYNRLLASGGSIIVNRTEAQVIADLGGSIPGVKLEVASDADADLVLVDLITEAQMVNEVFFQDNVAASQTAVALGTRVRTTFSDVEMTRAGSIIGMSARYNAPVTAGTATLAVAINGTPGTLALASTAAVNPSGGQAVQAPGVDVFAAGDTLSIEITTDSGFLPITTDLEAWLEISLRSAG